MPAKNGAPRISRKIIKLPCFFLPNFINVKYSMSKAFTDLGSLIGNTQCGTLVIFLPLRFFAKTILVILKPQKQPFYHLSSSEFWIFLTLSSVKFFQKPMFKAAKSVKIAAFVFLNSAKIYFT